MNTWVRISNGNEAYFSGYDMGVGSKPINVVYQRPGVIVFKVPPGSHWSALFSPHTYDPAHFLVCLVTQIDEQANAFFIEELASIDVRALPVEFNPELLAK